MSIKSKWIQLRIFFPFEPQIKISFKFELKIIKILLNNWHQNQKYNWHEYIFTF